MGEPGPQGEKVRGHMTHCACTGVCVLGFNKLTTDALLFRVVKDGEESQVFQVQREKL